VIRINNSPESKEIAMFKHFLFRRRLQEHPLRAVVINGGKGCACNIICPINPLLLGIVLKKGVAYGCLRTAWITEIQPSRKMSTWLGKVGCPPIGRDVGWFACRDAGDKRGELILITALIGVLVVSLAVLLAVAGLAVVQRLVPLPIRQSHNDATGIIYAALYVMFGVAIGFSLYLVWQQYDAAQKVAESEAANVEALYRLAGSFPEPERGQIQDLATSYTRVVVEEEWPLMAQGRTSPRAEALLAELQGSIQDIEPGTEAEQALLSEGLTQVGELNERRALRLLEVREGFPPILWVVLVVGGVITVAFTYLFGMETLWLHRLAVAALTVVVSLILYTVSVLEYPFNDAAQVRPDAFELVLRQIEGNDGQ
jgi:hypothetical protein